METQELWKNWEGDQAYGELFYKRATGELPEMESSKSVARFLKAHYSSGMKVLDVGCGAGHYLRSLRGILDAKIDYHGVDPTEAYVKLARKAFGSEALFSTGSVTDIPFPDQSFDIVMCNNVVMHLPPEILADAFRELMRVSRHIVILRAMFGVRNYIVREILTEHDFFPGENRKETFPDLNLLNSRFNYFNSYTESYYDALARNAGASSAEFIPDRDWQAFDNVSDTRISTATRTWGEFQVSGNILLDWRYILLRK